MEYPRRYLNQEFKATRWEAVEPITRELLTRPIESVSELDRWAEDCSELLSAIAEETTLRELRTFQNTSDESARAHHQEMVSWLTGQLESSWNSIEERLLKHPRSHQLDKAEYGQYLSRIEDNLAVFREKNAPIQQTLAELVSKYPQITGAQTVELDGEVVSLSAAEGRMEGPDRGLREKIWRMVAARKKEDAERIDNLYGKTVELRHQMALNAGYPDARAMIWQEKHRDYSPDDVLRLLDAIEAIVVPKVRELEAELASRIGPLRPWDSLSNSDQGEKLRPYSDTNELFERMEALFHRVSPYFGRQFKRLRSLDMMDVDGRPGKLPGAFNTILPERRLPFIFLNIRNAHSDLVDMSHEFGHAFQALENRHQRLLTNRDAPLEFHEVASMSMELLTAEHFCPVFYTEEESRRARKRQSYLVLQRFCTLACYEGFLHEVHTHPEYSPQERRQTWLSLHDRFRGPKDWSGFEEARATQWQSVPHFFLYPFYNIEYVIALTGALQVWRNYRADAEGTVNSLRNAWKLGNTAPLPKLFEAAGLKLDFSKAALARSVEEVMETLASL